MDPGLFDYNDQYTFPFAGSPHSESPEYPLKDVAMIDSTCRSWYDMTPVGDEPGLCTITGDKPGGGPWMGYCIWALGMTSPRFPTAQR